MSEKSNSLIEYEPPTVTYYGDVSTLTGSVITAPGSDALCTQPGIPVEGVPSNVVCKTVP